MNSRNRIFILLAVICAASLAYYFLSTPSSKDLVLIGTVDSNQVIVSPQMQGRLAKLLVDEGTQVKQGDLIAVLDPAELEAQERAAEVAQQQEIERKERTLARLRAAGTMAHSYVEAFASEADAFRAFVADYPENAVLLVDTYDTHVGVEHAIDVIIEAGVGERAGTYALTA